MYKVKTEEKEHYLLVVVNGDYDVKPFKDLITDLVDWSKRTQKTRILINTLGVSMPKSEFDKFILGEEFAKIAKPPIKIAILSPPALINKFMEDTAVNRGSLLFACSDREEALRWLLSGLQKTDE